MPHLSLRDQRDYEEFDEFVCERFRLLSPSSSIREIAGLRFFRNRCYFLMAANWEALEDDALVVEDD